MAARKVILSVSVSHDVANWLAQKKKQQNVNVSALINQLIEEQIIREMENGLENN